MQQLAEVLPRKCTLHVSDPHEVIWVDCGNTMQGNTMQGNTMHCNSFFFLTKNPTG